MVTVKIVMFPAFRVMGKKTWIDTVEDFHTFWSQCHQDGTIAQLMGIGTTPGPVSASKVFGVSRVEDDPENRKFYVYIVSEIPESAIVPQAFEAFHIPTATWAVFEAEGEMLKALYEAEMYAFGKWLPESGYRHAAAPELEVYPASDWNKVQFWLPIID